jgi:hypothetical protein
MIHLYIWKPTKVSEVIEQGMMPDLGHASLEVIEEASGKTTYMSFWPELESFVGAAIRHWKHRETRHPSSYAEECDPAGGYMQRTADVVETLHGLNEARILREWPQVRELEYHLRSWNCSNVCKYLLISAMTPEDYARIESCAACSVDDLKQIREGQNVSEILRYLTTSPFIDCRPEDVLRMAVAYNERIEKPANDALENAETVTIPPVSVSATVS